MLFLTQKFGFKILSFTVCFVFTFNSLLSAAPISKVYNLKISSKIGKVKERWKSSTPANTQKPIVVHIQDAHASLEAQKNIAKIIEKFTRRTDKNFSNDILVCTEGAKGKCNTSIVSSFPDKSAREFVAGEFLKNGKFTGAEYQSAIAKGKFSLFGVEDRRLYIENYNAYLNVTQKRNIIRPFINEVESSIHKIGIKFNSKALTSVYKNFQDYKRNKIDLLNYALHLYQEAQENQMEVLEFLNFSLFIEAIKIGGNVNHAFLVSEKEKLQEILKSNNHNKELTDISKDNILDEQGYFQFLANMIETLKLSKSDFKNIGLYSAYLDKFARVDVAALMYEIRQLRWNLEDRLSTNIKEKSLLKLQRVLEILHLIVDLQAVHDDLRYFRENREFFNGVKICDILTELNQKIDYDFAVHQDLAQLIDAADKFYEVAENRNEMLVANTINEAERLSLKDEYLFLIAGGYHTKGITEELRTNQIPYIVITPEISNTLTSIPYEDRMLLKVSPFEKIINNPQVSKMAFQLMSAEKPLLEWADNLPESVLPEIKEKIQGGKYKIYHEKAIINALYIVGFIKFVVGEEKFSLQASVGEEFYRNVSVKHEYEFKDFLTQNKWEAIVKLRDTTTFDIESSNSKQMVFNIDGYPISFNFKELFEHGFDVSVKSGKPEKILGEYSNNQLTRLYEKLFQAFISQLDTTNMALRVSSSPEKGGAFTPATGAKMPWLSDRMLKRYKFKKEKLNFWQTLVEQVPWALVNFISIFSGHSLFTYCSIGICFFGFILGHYLFLNQPKSDVVFFDVLKVAGINLATSISLVIIAVFLPAITQIVPVKFLISLAGSLIAWMLHFDFNKSLDRKSGQIIARPGMPDSRKIFPISSQEISRRSFFRKTSVFTVFSIASIVMLPMKILAKTGIKSWSLRKASAFKPDAFAVGSTGYYQVGIFDKKKADSLCKWVNKMNLEYGVQAKVKPAKNGVFRVLVKFLSGNEKVKKACKNILSAKKALLDLDMATIESTITKESGWKENKISPKWAIGIAQTMPAAVIDVLKLKGKERKIKKNIEDLKKEPFNGEDEKNIKMAKIEFKENQLRILSAIPDFVLDQHALEKVTIGADRSEYKFGNKSDFWSLKNNAKKEADNVNKENIKCARIVLLALEHGPLNAVFGMTHFALYKNKIEYYKKIKKIDTDTDPLLAARLSYNTGIGYFMRALRNTGGWSKIFDVAKKRKDKEGKIYKPFSLIPETVDYGYAFIRDYTVYKLSQNDFCQFHPDHYLHMWLCLKAFKGSRFYSDFKKEMSKNKELDSKKSKLYNYKKEVDAFDKNLDKILSSVQKRSFQSFELNKAIKTLTESVPSWPLVREVENYFYLIKKNYDAIRLHQESVINEVLETDVPESESEPEPEPEPEIIEPEFNVKPVRKVPDSEFLDEGSYVSDIDFSKFMPFYVISSAGLLIGAALESLRQRKREVLRRKRISTIGLNKKIEVRLETDKARPTGGFFSIIDGRVYVFFARKGRMVDYSLLAVLKFLKIINNFFLSPLINVQAQTLFQKTGFKKYQGIYFNWKQSSIFQIIAISIGLGFYPVHTLIGLISIFTGHYVYKYFKLIDDASYTLSPNALKVIVALSGVFFCALGLFSVPYLVGLFHSFSLKGILASLFQPVVSGACVYPFINFDFAERKHPNISNNEFYFFGHKYQPEDWYLFKELPEQILLKVKFRLNLKEIDENKIHFNINQHNDGQSLVFGAYYKDKKSIFNSYRFLYRFDLNIIQGKTPTLQLNYVDISKRLYLSQKEEKLLFSSVLNNLFLLLNEKGINDLVFTGDVARNISANSFKTVLNDVFRINEISDVNLEYGIKDSKLNLFYRDDFSADEYMLLNRDDGHKITIPSEYNGIGNQELKNRLDNFGMVLPDLLSKTINVFINADCINRNTMRMFNDTTLGLLQEYSQIKPVFFSGKRSSADIKRQVLFYGLSESNFYTWGKDNGMSESVDNIADSFENMCREFFHTINFDKAKLIVIDKGSQREGLTDLSKYIKQNELAWLGIVNPRFQFNNKRLMKKYISELQMPATILTQIEYFLANILNGEVPYEENMFLPSVLSISPAVRENLISEMEDINKSEFLRQAA